jgi:hypothetical protein
LASITVGSGTDASNAAAESILAQRKEALASSAADSFLNIDVLCTGFVLLSPSALTAPAYG